jgi:hypothetical protein
LYLFQFVGDGVFKAELNEFLTRELAEDGYSGVEVRVTPTRTEIIIMATRTQSVLGEKGRRIRELTSVVQKRFNFPEHTLELYAEKVATRGLCAIAQAESLRYKLIGGLAVRRSVKNSVLPFLILILGTAAFINSGLLSNVYMYMVKELLLDRLIFWSHFSTSRHFYGQKQARALKFQQ